jgi:pyruvate dehydrogenase E1 component alpha subunit
MAIQARNRVPSAAASGQNGHTLISDGKFRQLYGLALRVRMLAQNANGSGGAWLRGREAALAAVAADLRADDVVIAGEGARQAGLRGVLPAAPDGRAGSFAERVIAAVSGAAADRMRKNGRVTVIFTQEDAHEELQEARALASAGKLPVLLVEPVRKTVGNAAPPGKTTGNELPEIPVDAQDVIALYRVAHESIARARGGGGPTVIACRSWKAPVKKGKGLLSSVDAIAHLEEWLTARGLPAQKWRREIVAAF